MRQENRSFKNGKKITAEVKSYLVTVQKELISGKLDKRGEEARIFASVIPKKKVPEDARICLRIAIRKFNGNLLMYLHSFGWIELKDSEINEVFKANKEIKIEDLLYSSYNELSIKDKIKLINKYCPDIYTNYTKTEKLLIAYLDGKDLNEVEKEINVDSSLKYKIKKHPEKFEETFVKKLESSLLA